MREVWIQVLIEYFRAKHPGAGYEHLRRWSEYALDLQLSEMNDYLTR